MSEWVSVNDRLPEDGQHVLVYDGMNNVCSGLGDNEYGQIKIGDAVYYSGQVAWDDMVVNGQASRWDNDLSKYLSCNNKWDEWSGQGPCEFTKVTHWMSLPKPPKEAAK